MRKIFTVIIITVFLPILTFAHQGHDEARQQWEQIAGVLPGEVYYFIDRSAEWIDINLLTLSTKQKQKKILASSDERLYELAMLSDLAETIPVREKTLQSSAEIYAATLGKARDFAQKIIFLDGAELALAEDFEKKTFEHEELLATIREEIAPVANGPVNEALIAARNNNREIFEYMVVNYQFTGEDIAKYQAILDRHIEFIESFLDELGDGEKTEQIKAALSKAREFRDAGLNAEAYGYIEQAKNILY